MKDLESWLWPGQNGHSLGQSRRNQAVLGRDPEITAPRDTFSRTGHLGHIDLNRNHILVPKIKAINFVFQRKVPLNWLIDESTIWSTILELSESKQRTEELNQSKLGRTERRQKQKRSEEGRGATEGEEETLSSFKAWGPHSHSREQVPTNVYSFAVLEWPGSFPSSPGLNNNTLFSLVIWLLVFDPQHLGQELGALGSPLTLLTDHSLHHWIWFSSLEGVALGE